IRDGSGKLHRERLQIYHPARIDKAGYNDFDLPWLPQTLSAKYYADASGVSMASPDKLLVLRLVDRGRETARVSLSPGQSGMLGGMNVRLVGVEKWTGLIFVNMPGMGWVFFGFSIIVLGVILQYCTPPRELYAQRGADGLRLSWKATRFSEFYEDEYRSIIAAVGGGDMA
ncbi:MAG TPA: cytochrome C biogenesis protein ResB, partial [Geobacteraceae bacterium]